MEGSGDLATEVGIAVGILPLFKERLVICQERDPAEMACVILLTIPRNGNYYE